MSTATLDFVRFQVGRFCTATLARLGATLINFKRRGWVSRATCCRNQSNVGCSCAAKEFTAVQTSSAHIFPLLCHSRRRFFSLRCGFSSSVTRV